MKTFTKSALLAATVAMGLGLSACDSKSENAIESKAQDVREASDAAADAIETQADKMDDKAAAVRETGDAKADAMEDKTAKMDKTPG